MKFTPPYPCTLVPLAWEEGLRFSFPFTGLATFGASSKLPGPGQVIGLCGREPKEEMLFLGPYEVNELLLAVGLEASLSYMGPVTRHSSKESKLTPGYWLAPIPALLPAFKLGLLEE